MKKLVLFTLLLIATASFAMAHSGGTDQNGCHYNHKTGDYHCH